MPSTLDAAGAPPPAPAPPTSGLATDLTATINATPELANDPASAVAVAASGGDVVLKGNGVGHAVNQTAKVQAAAQVQQSGGLFGDLGHVFGDVASDVGQVLNKPLQIVQHEYRYLHDVEARHGMGAAFEEGLGLAVGAAVGGTLGTLAGGNTFEGAALGAEGAGYLEGQASYKDSWARTTNGATYRDPHTGQLVSFGRDLAAHIGGGKPISGVIDGIADLAADPVGLVGKAYAAQKTLSITSENIDKAWVNPLSGFKRAANDIAASDYGTIVSHYKQFEDVAHELAALHTGEQVRDFFKSLVSANEMMDATKLPTVNEAADGVSPVVTSAENLPSLSPFHVPLRSLRDAARDSGKGTGFFSKHVMNNTLIGPGRWADRLESLPGNSFNKDTGDMTGWQYDPGSNVGANDVMKMVRYSSGETAARAVANALDGATEAQRVTVFRNAFMKTLFHMARVDDEGYGDLALTNPQMEKSMLELVDGKTKQAVVERLQNHMAAVPVDGSAPGTQYGTTWAGDNIKPMVDAEGNSIQGGITPNQRGLLSIPNIVEARRMAAAIRQGKTSMFLGGVDDFFYDHVTQGLFKPLVLMSGGYAFHIALAELIPNTLRHGLRPSVAAIRDRALSDLGYKAESEALDGKQLDGLTGWLYRAVGGSGIQDQQKVKYAIQLRELNGGEVAPEAFRAGEAQQGEIQPTLRAEGGARQVMAQGYRQGKRFYAIGNEDPRFADAWHAELAENVNRWTMTAAKRYQQALSEGILPRDVAPSLLRRRPTGASTLSQLTSGPLFRESSAQDAVDTLAGSSSGLSGPARKYWSNDRGLALGQGESKGVVVEKDAGNLHGSIDMSKPGAEFQVSQGRAEFQAAHWRTGGEGLAGRGIRSVEIKPEALAHKPYTDEERMSGLRKPPERLNSQMENNAVTSLRRTLDREGFRKFDVGDGGERWVRPDLLKPMDWKRASEAARQRVAGLLRYEKAQGRSDLLARSTNKMDGAPQGWDAVDGHAQAIVDKMMGAVHARPTRFDEDGRALAPGPVHDDLLASIANGRVPTREEVHGIDSAQRPLNVKARELVPMNNGAVQAIANAGFRKFLNPIVNVLSRNQEFMIEYTRLREEMQPLVDAGFKSEDEALTEAAAKATQHGMRFVHNLHDRTQWTATMRNWAPFFFAQEQSYRRMGRLLVEDPGAFRRYQMMISGVHNIAANLQDSTGNSYIAIPGSGFLGTGVAEIMGEGGLTVGNISPSSLGGSFSSANVIFPLSNGVAPEWGPLVLVPAAQLSAMFTELNRNYAGHNAALSVAASDLAWVAGPQTMNQSFWEQIIPNATAQRVLQSALGDDRSFNSSVMQSYQWAMYQQAKATEAWVKGGKKGPEPELVPPADATAMQKQIFQDRIRNYTRMNFFVRALVGFFSPVSASVEVQNLGIPARLQKYITSQGSVSLGMQAAHIDHPEWDPWMVSESFVPSEVDQTQSSGYSLSSSIPAQQWVAQNQGLLDKYGVSALWLMPQLKDAKYSPTIYNEQIAQGLRIKDTPDQFLAALYTNAGNNLYYDALSIHENALSAAGNSSLATNAEYDNWNNYVTKLEQQNPVWAENFLSANKQLNRTDALKQLNTMLTSGDAPAGEMTDNVAFLMEQYQAAAADYHAASQQRSYSLQLSEQKKVADNWITYLDNLEIEMPQLKPVIQGVFKDALDVRTN